MAGLFPLAEVFGYAWDATSPEAHRAGTERWCRFSNSQCEKFRQYAFGYCSVSYAAADDERVPQVYAVCDHRLDGQPLDFVLADHFGDSQTILVPEIVLTNPRTSFDYVAFSTDDPEDVVAIETQAIDIRGGGVGPAFRAWADGRPSEWRAYFTEEATRKGRRDNVAFGVNMANIYKRLGLQVAVKGSYLNGIGVPFYVLMQHRPFEYLRRRIAFEESHGDWDVSFITFDYTGGRYPDGSLEFSHIRTFRTTLTSYVSALANDTGLAKAERREFLDRVKRKAGL